MRSKRGQILVENLIFIILNLAFLAIMFLFVIKQGAGATILEQTYAKQISLIIDSAQPGAIIKINMADAKEVADEKGVPFVDVVSFNKNSVTVKLSKGGGYTYTFFNNVEVNSYVVEDVFYVITVDRKMKSGGATP
ncbi:hypothetical protein B6U91_02195 [Candidatus Pacearchaeota archaeon ex4484_71]|nr:MAG: hypothetical protein B6U91_02195 [Candidatus Pacearchaeota archaeon ex4484_71]